MNILERINARKREEVAMCKAQRPASSLEKSALFSRPVLSISRAVRESEFHGIIAEFKRSSPSAGEIRPGALLEEIVPAYAAAHAAAISVLTDNGFFGGSAEDLTRARELVNIPILRKDFIIDEYQVVEARAIGADAILLIAASLSTPELMRLTGVAHALGLEVLLEVHDAGELDRSLGVGVDLIGVNNRDLRTFQTSLDTSRNLISRIPATMTAISESGISSPEAIAELEALGYKGFLIGNHFMSMPDPGQACRQLTNSILESR